MSAWDDFVRMRDALDGLIHRAKAMPGLLQVRGNINLLGDYHYMIDGVSQGVWNDWTPTVAGGLTVGSGAWQYGRYLYDGAFIEARAQFVLNSSSITGGVSINYPVACAEDIGYTPVGLASYIDAGTAAYRGVLIGASSTVFNLWITSVSGTYPVYGNLSSIIPFTWTDGDVIGLFLRYRWK